MGTEVIIGWIQTIHTAGAVYISFFFVVGIAFAAMVFMNIKQMSSMGQMQTRNPPSVTATIAFAIGSAMAIYIAGWINALDETIFSGVISLGTNDPLTWRVDDTVNPGGSHEEVIKLFLKTVIKFFGLIGIGNSINCVLKIGTQYEKEDTKKKAILFALAGIAFMRIEATTKLVAELIPLLDGIAEILA
ncbi:hypothetical protein [Shewanella inventionis]|nr:hypothetical protein [Shewanella inventionis]